MKEVALSWALVERQHHQADLEALLLPSCPSSFPSQDLLPESEQAEVLKHQKWLDMRHALLSRIIARRACARALALDTFQGFEVNIVKQQRGMGAGKTGGRGCSIPNGPMFPRAMGTPPPPIQGGAEVWRQRRGWWYSHGPGGEGRGIPVAQGISVGPGELNERTRTHPSRTHPKAGSGYYKPQRKPASKNPSENPSPEPSPNLLLLVVFVSTSCFSRTWGPTKPGGRVVVFPQPHSSYLWPEGRRPRVGTWKGIRENGTSQGPLSGPPSFPAPLKRKTPLRGP